MDGDAATVGAALAGPERRQILDLLDHGPATADDVAGAVELTRKAVAEHLDVLLHATLVEVEPTARGPEYHLRDGVFEEIAAVLAAHEELWRDRSDALHVEVARTTRSDRKGSS